MSIVYILRQGRNKVINLLQSENGRHSAVNLHLHRPIIQIHANLDTSRVLFVRKYSHEHMHIVICIPMCGNVIKYLSSAQIRFRISRFRALHLEHHGRPFKMIAHIHIYIRLTPSLTYCTHCVE
jgi:hypothetical protein